jgi:Domain of unknown function (DUF4136)
MNLRLSRLAAGLLLFLATGVAALAQDVKVDYDHSASFQGYKTYAWQPGTPAKNPLNDQRIIAAVDSQLMAKGLQKVTMDQNPDLVVLYHAATSTQTQYNTTSFGGWGWGWGWGGGGTTTTNVEQIPIGQLSVDIGDAKTKKLLWLGTASGTISDNPNKSTEKLNKAVAKMFKNFPPSPNSK